MSNAVAPQIFNPQQTNIIKARAGAYCVDAGAGVGKTATITERTKHLILGGVAPERILLVTFTVKAALEMGERVERAVGNPLPWATNFHRLCMKLLRGFPEFGLQKPKVADEDAQKKIVRTCARELYGIEKPDTKLVDQVLRQVALQRQHQMGYANRGVTPDASKLPVIRSLANDYEKALRQEGKVDFDRMIYDVVLGLRESLELRQRIQGLWDFVIIDEAQDTNQAQFELMSLIVPPKGGRHKNIMLVGDIDQCIFGFSGAEVTNLQRFMETYSATRLPLEMNYRSRAEILDAANIIIQENKVRTPKTLRPTLGRGGIVEILEHPNTGYEAKWIADQVWMAIKGGVRPKDIAVLYRIGALSREIESAFLPMRIPYRVVGGLRFWERREVKDTLAYARVFLGNADADAWDRALGSMSMGIGDKAWERIRQAPTMEEGMRAIRTPKAQAWLTALLQARTRTEPPARAIRWMLEACGFLAEINAKASKKEEALQRLANVDEALNAMTQTEDLESWLEETALGFPSKEDREESNGVTLSTIHAAKGLEWKRVFLVGLVDGVLPHARSMSASEREEERRLLYVAITRARDHLSITFPRLRMDQGQSVPVQKSCFLHAFKPIRRAV